MKSTCLIVLAVGLMTVGAARPIIERRLNREFNICGPTLFAVLGRICGTHRYDPEIAGAQGQDSQKPSISSMCCEKRCKVVDVINTFCPDKRCSNGQMWPNKVDFLPPSTDRTTTESYVTITKLTTTTEKLANVWYITG